MSIAGHDTNIVVVALLRRDNQLFIARRADTKQTWPGRFELIGGHVDPGETLEQALCREVQEEIGVDVTIGEIVGAFTYESEDTFKVEICYLCELADTSAEPVINPEDHSEGRWITAHEISVLEKEDNETELIRKAFTIIESNQSQKEGEN
jgi:mutator protein MutT